MELRDIALTGAALLALGGGALLWRPGGMRRALLAFPRHPWAAAVLTLVCLAWVGWIMDQSVMVSHTLRRFGGARPVVLIFCPLAVFMILRYMPDLLAARALGGFMLLLATPVLDAIRWHPSAWRLVVTTLCYAMIVAGMALVLSPYGLRLMVERRLGTDRACRWAAGLLLGLAGLLLVVAVMSGPVSAGA